MKGLSGVIKEIPRDSKITYNGQELPVRKIVIEATTEDVAIANIEVIVENIELEDLDFEIQGYELTWKGLLTKLYRKLINEIKKKWLRTRSVIKLLLKR
jgi:ethanolamine utilization protein EutA (predicted chaperonin)